MTKLQLKFYKLVHWEFWPMELIYYPMFPVWLYFSFKARSLFFFNAANPTIKNGGMAMESKKEIYDLIPKQFIPKTLFVKKGTCITEIEMNRSKEHILFPCIVKPDIGMKAFAVELSTNKNELMNYTQRVSTDFLIQELITFENEIGVFYVRFPNENKGRITGIVSKEFLKVEGNSKETILALIKKNHRSLNQLETLKNKYGDFLNTILPVGESFILVPYGSHTRGAKFIDISHLVTEELTCRIDSICKEIPGFFYGRLDIRYTNLNDLSNGHNFSIIEINGAGSEPTHIYDPKHSLLFAWKEIIKHWRLLFKISIMNKKEGHSYLSYKDGRKMLKENSRLEIKLRKI